MKEFQPGAHHNNEEPNKERRGFMKGILAGMAGAAGLYTGNKYIKQEQELNAFAERFKGKEESYLLAGEASYLLITEMVMANIRSVNLSGTGHSNDRIEILRNFLFRHLTKKEIGNKYSVQKMILEQGIFTEDTLRILNQEAQMLSGSQREPPVRSYTPSDKKEV